MILHGYAEYGGRYAYVADHFVSQGWAVIASDHAGHGLSDGERALITDFGLAVDDLGAVAESAETHFGDVDQDPLVYRGLYKRPLLETEVIALDEFRAEIDRIEIPVAFFRGDSDPFVPYVDSLQAVLDMPSFDKRIKIYPGAEHELVNETNRQEVIADLSHWVAGVLH